MKVADIIRAVEGPLASVRSERPEELDYHGVAEPLRDVWIALWANIRGVLELVTLADVVDRHLPPSVVKLTKGDEVWEPH